MRALVFHGVHDMVIEDRNLPTVREGQVLLKVGAVGICGSELEAFAGSSAKRHPPLVLGHEIAGTVVGADEERLFAVNPLESCGLCRDCRAGHANRCGARQLLSLHLDGGHAEYIAVSSSSLVALGGLTDPAVGALVEPLATAVNAVGGPDSVQGRRVAVIGCGSLGLMAVRLATMWGAEIVVASDLNAARLAIAERLGAIAFNAVEGHAHFDVVLDMVGSAVTRRTAVSTASRGATVKLVGLQCANSEISFSDVISREITVQGVYAYTPEQFALAAEILAEGDVGLEGIITRARLDEGPDMFRLLAADPQSLVKVVLVP